MASGYYLPKSAGRYNCRSIVMYCMDIHRDDDFYERRNIHSLEDKNNFRCDFARSFHDEMLALPKGTHSVIFSSEHFHSRLKTQQEVDRVRALLAPYFNEFKIVCYLREQAACCNSYYSTAIKTGQIISLGDVFKACVPENHYYNYNKMLSLWAASFGFSALNVSLFDSNRFLNHSLLDDFSAKIGSELTGKLTTNIPIKNESLSYMGQVVSKALSLLLPANIKSGRIKTIRRRYQKSISKKLTGRGTQPSYQLKKEIYAAFKESNEELRKKFFPELDLLFQPPEKE